MDTRKLLVFHGVLMEGEVSFTISLKSRRPALSCKISGGFIKNFGFSKTLSSGIYIQQVST
jgi:hypothetical protein